uniref:Sulfotransferase family protein n=1 Tax=Candidatus Kentrum sp. UNK TaxID=2126344 RepID=A0A451B472_9GAMM|nr:MAG: Sulfotransferase family protein [Candidatus Kentron sp. UNK]VFK73065.1 MAG: Sulfotransferase family protein [Candidatus Kentron sp. UNK]
MFFTIIFLSIYITMVWLAPFPYWRTYFILWKHVLFNWKKEINIKAKSRQLKFLLKYLLLCPLWTLLWCLDELLFPGYRRQQIRPIFIIGQPRSGTTFLHRTLAEDNKNFFAIRHIEWRYPYITIQKILNLPWLSNKLKTINYWPDTEAGEKAAKMHPDTLFDWEEDGIFFEECFLHHFFIFLRFPYPELLSDLDSFPELPNKIQKHILKTHKKVIQKVMYLRKKDVFYLSKEVTSHNKIESLVNLYSEAKFIMVFRSYSDYMSSLLELVRYSTLSKTDIDPIIIPGWKAAFVERMRRHSLYLAELHSRQLDGKICIYLSFEHVTKNIFSSTERIYDFLKKQPDFLYLQYIKQVQRHQKNRKRGYEYQKEDFENLDGL